MGRLNQTSGFTMIELVAVITILGAVSVGIFGFIRSGVAVFSDVTERDRILSDSRFVVERLNREVRRALPNSARTARGFAGGQVVQCLEFIPVLWSSVYFDIPTGAESATSIEAVPWDITNFIYTYQPLIDDHYVVVYPTSTADGYDASRNKRYLLDAQPVHTGNDNPITLTFGTAVTFEEDSPSERMYVVDQPVSYCAEADGDILRYSGYGFNVSQRLFNLGTGALMAQNQSNDLNVVSVLPFQVEPASLVRNSTIITLLQFSLGGEVVVFNNEVHLPNAP